MNQILQVSSYRVSIRSDLEVGSSVVKVEATDRDIGLNSDLSYSIYPGDNSGVTNIFTMNADTGVISLKKSVQNQGLNVFLSHFFGCKEFFLNILRLKLLRQ